MGGIFDPAIFDREIFDVKWFKAKKRKPMECCPICGACGDELNVYWTRDIFDKEKRLFRCDNCFTELIWENGHWIAVKSVDKW